MNVVSLRAERRKNGKEDEMETTPERIIVTTNEIVSLRAERRKMAKRMKWRRRRNVLVSILSFVLNAALLVLLTAFTVFAYHYA